MKTARAGLRRGPQRGTRVGMPLVMLALTLAATACDNGSSSSTPTTPTVAPATIENLTGTVPVGGTDVKPFNVMLSGGLLTVTLNAAGPPSTIVMGVGIGNPNGAACTFLAGGTFLSAASPNVLLSGQVNAGSYCVAVFDAGSGAQMAPVTYAVTVTHY